MSLKAFHVLFITVAVLMILGCGGWALSAWLQSGYAGSLVAAIGAFLGAVTLIVYEVIFIRKTKGVL